jgi:hypothetical protein
MKVFLISFFTVVQLRQFGPLLLIALELTMYPILLTNVGHGVSVGRLLASSFILWALLPFAGQFGKLETKVVLKGKKIRNPAEIICYACGLMTYWAGLFPEMDKETLQAGVTTMLQIATKLMIKSKQGGGNLFLKERSDDNSQN